ncbi:hypothetical protein AB0873_22675 [Micromonospora sp. NPDC047707]|nr:hypothetical protein [Micromonospora sp. WMMC415]
MWERPVAEGYRVDLRVHVLRVIDPGHLDEEALLSTALSVGEQSR